VLTADTVLSVKALEIGPPSNGPPSSPAVGTPPAFIGRPLHLMERDVIIGTLQATGGNRTRTATMLGLSIRALRNKISLYAAQGIDVPPSSAGAPAVARMP
jgi:DNA-binding NtrC family response regulator